MRVHELDETLEDLPRRFTPMALNRLEKQLLSQSLSGATARVAQSVGEEDQQIVHRIPGAPRRNWLPVCHAERRVLGG